jgi:hypothetical protein
MTKRGWVVLALWYLILIAASNVFEYVHPTATPNNPDALTTAFNIAFFVLLFAGIFFVPRRYAKKPTDQQLPTTQNTPIT